MILILDTSQKEAIVALKGPSYFEKKQWEAGRELSATIFDQIDSLFPPEKNLSDITGVIVSSGPGSFTGLRIGITIANALAYSLNIPIVELHEVDDFETLVVNGEEKLTGKSGFDAPIIPFYGSEPNITKPKKSV